MSRPTIFRRALDILNLPTPVSDFPGFVRYSEYSGLSSSDADVLNKMFLSARGDLFLLISMDDQSFSEESCKSLASSLDLDVGYIYGLIFDIRFSITLPLGSAEEVPFVFTESFLKFSTAGCMKGEIAVIGCKVGDSFYKIPEYVSDGRKNYHVVSIGPNAFSGMDFLKSVILPNSIREIGYMAFAGCSSLDDFIIPASVRRIGFRAFKGCTAMPYIAVHHDNPFFKTLPGGVLCAMKTVDGESVPSEIIRAPYSLNGSFTAPSGLTRIGSESFEGCSGLTEVMLPDEVDSVMYRAFEGCPSLSHISLPDKASIGFHAFPEDALVETREVPASTGDVLEE